MTIDTASVLDGATTYVAPTGGTSTTLVKFKGAPTVIAKLASESGILDRTSLEFSAKDPVIQPNAPGGYTQSRARVLIKAPITLANGNRTTNTIEINLSVDPETATNDIKAFRLLASQVLGSTDFNEFFNSHNMS